LFDRVERAYRRIASCAAARVAVVAHGGPLRLLRCLMMGLPLSERWAVSIALGEALRIRR
jgi:broad specificity phosphatase PhoE